MKLFLPLAISLTLIANAAPVWAAPAADAPILDWPAESALADTFTLESPRLKGSDLVAAVAAQTKVKLDLPAELLGRSLVLRANKMPLSQLLPALGQLYGLEWTRGAAPASFRARVAATPTELALLQLGDINDQRDRARLFATQSELETIEAARAFDADKLAAGLAVSELPAGLYRSLQTAKQRRAALNYLADVAPWTPFAMRQMRVRVELPRANDVGMASAPQFALVDPSGTSRLSLGAMQLPAELLADGE